MDKSIPTLQIKIMLESNPLESRVVARGWAAAAQPLLPRGFERVPHAERRGGSARAASQRVRSGRPGAGPPRGSFRRRKEQLPLGDFASQDLEIYLCVAFAWIRRLRKSPQYLLVILPRTKTAVSTILREASSKSSQRTQNSWLTKFPRGLGTPGHENR